MDIIDNYELIYDLETGVCTGVAGIATSAGIKFFIPIREGVAEYDTFIIWNNAQTTPLDPKVPDPVISARYAAKLQNIIDNLSSWQDINNEYVAMIDGGTGDNHSKSVE